MEAGCPHAALRPGAVAEQCPFLAAQGRLDAPAKFAEPVLDTGDIQADVVLGVNMKQHLLVVYYDITDAAAAKRWLREDVLPNVTTADNMRAFRDKFREARLMAPGGAKPVLAGSQTLNVSFSYAGLTLLDAPDVKMFEGPDCFGTAFSIDLPKRAGLLGDLESGCPPSGWLTGGARSPHVLIQIGTDSLDEFEALRRRYAPFISEAPLEVAALDAQGVKFVHADEAHRLDSRGSEQFGFHDAVSNPALRGYYSDGVTPLSTRTFEGDRDVALPGQDLLYPGEFIVLRDQETDAVWTEGLASEGGARQPSSETWKSKYASTMPDWAANGAFLVNRRLRQDVSGFWSWCEAEAQKEANASHRSASAPLTAEAIAARLFGRWPSGCPLARSPLTDIAELGDDKLANNAYAFAVPSLVKTAPGDAFPKAVAVDVDGIVCPLSAHTRKMNPRDGPNDVSTPLKRRLMRRGLPYGPQLVNPKSGIDDGKDRGLMFIAYCSSIEEQFEFLQRKWANSEHSPTEPTDIDPIIGQVWPPDDL
jgi:Dyp-type peroxidase family